MCIHTHTHKHTHKHTHTNTHTHTHKHTHTHTRAHTPLHPCTKHPFTTPIDISPHKPEKYVLQIVVWNTKDAILVRFL